MRPETDLSGRAAEKHAPVTVRSVETVRSAITTAVPAAAEGV
jgi:hypothetical protein